MSAAEIIPVMESFDLPALDQTPFKRLRMDHRRVVHLHIEGVANKDIAVSLHRSAAWVGNVLRNPAVTPVLDALYNDYNKELQGLTSLAIEAIRSGLDSDEPMVKLRSADLLFKRQGVYEKDPSATISAEDVIARFLSAVGKVRETDHTGASLLRLDEPKEDVIDVPS